MSRDKTLSVQLPGFDNVLTEVSMESFEGGIFKGLMLFLICTNTVKALKVAYRNYLINACSSTSKCNNKTIM